MDFPEFHGRVDCDANIMQDEGAHKILGVNGIVRRRLYSSETWKFVLRWLPVTVARLSILSTSSSGRIEQRRLEAVLDQYLFGRKLEINVRWFW